MKSLNSHCFFRYFCSPAPVHEGMKNTKTIHFLLFFQYFCSPASRDIGLWDLDVGLWTLDLRFWTSDLWSLDSTLGSTLNSGLEALDLEF